MQGDRILIGQILGHQILGGQILGHQILGHQILGHQIQGDQILPQPGPAQARCAGPGAGDWAVRGKVGGTAGPSSTNTQECYPAPRGTIFKFLVVHHFSHRSAV